jgi:N-acyl-D-amino-acid deacylase
MQCDIVVRNGTVFDGTGGGEFRADILVKNGRIVGVEKARNRYDAELFINADGKAVCPGFIDVHTHAGFIFASSDQARLLEPFVRQGITTMVTGNCGTSPAPINQDAIEHVSAYWDCILPENGLSWNWQTMAEFLEHVERLRPIMNIAQVVGHGTVRLNAMGCGWRKPALQELEMMRAQVRQALDEGAFGLSFGLGYVPGVWADTDELTEVAREVGGGRGRITVHLRGQTTFFEKAVEEMIRVAETAGAPLQLSHFVPFNEEAANHFFRAYELTEAARTRGVEIGYDLLPYAVASTTIFMLYPPWMFDGGLPAFFERLRDPRIRDRLVDEFKHREPEWPQWETGTWCDKAYSEEVGWSMHRFYGFRSADLRRYEGLNLEAIAEDMGEGPLETFIELTLAEGGRLYYTSGHHDDEGFDMAMGGFLSLPHMACMTDAVGIGRRARHPSHYGAFPRFLGKHGRDWETFPLAEAIRKCTSLPASQLGLKDRGTIREGAFADLVIFDPETVSDTSSFAVPFQYAKGIEAVLVNGTPVWHLDEYREQQRAGMVLRRG